MITAAGVAALFAWLIPDARSALAVVAGALLLVGLLVVSARLTADHRAITELPLRRRSSSSPPDVDGDDRVMAAVSPRDASTKPIATVVVTACNERRFVLDCLESLRRQSVQDLEFIIVDDESTDGGVDLAFDAFAADRRFRFVSRRERSGLAAARNLGASLATAPWVTFLDGDDFLFPDAMAQRLAAVLSSRVSEAWLAGAYCNWMSVEEDATLEGTAERETPARYRIGWLDVVDDAPFIASAPILRTDVVRSLGGFDAALRSAEDFEFWTRLFRSGWVVEPVQYTGVAYRQKSGSMYRTTARLHAETTLAQYQRNREPLIDSEGHFGPFLHSEPCTEASVRLARVRRLVGALPAAVAARDRAATEWMTDALADQLECWMEPHGLDIEMIVRTSCRRLEHHRPDPEHLRASALERTVLERLAAIRSGLPRPAAVPAGVIQDASDAFELIERPRLRLTGATLEAETAGRILFLPAAAYHVVEFGPVAEELERRGHRCVMMATDRRWPSLVAQLRRYRVDALEAADPGRWVSDLAAVVTLNDWGELPREITVAANASGVPTIGKVEGVQDFDDDDVHWDRRPYQTVDHVLCQGRNDERNVQNVSRTIVGSVRLESIWNAPQRPFVDPVVVVNLNFTYGVLEDERDAWLASVVEACRRVGRPYVVSAHPAEKSRPPGVNFTDAPMTHLLTTGAVLVSRFSTVPFEAMARGVPFVYHNPHDEKVPTFKEPLGAFPITTTIGELAEALRASEAVQGHYREVSSDFFRAQIDIDPARSATVRTADAIVELARLG